MTYRYMSCYFLASILQRICRMDRIQWGRLLSVKDDRDGVTEEQLSRGSQKDVCPLSWYSIVCVFSLSVLGGLLITAAQIEMNRNRIAREHIANRGRFVHGRNRVPARIKWGISLSDRTGKTDSNSEHSKTSHFILETENRNNSSGEIFVDIDPGGNLTDKMIEDEQNTKSR